MLQLVVNNDMTTIKAPGFAMEGFNPREFAAWNVKVTGDYTADCATGAARADDLIQYIRAGGLPATLSHVVNSIAKRGGDLTGIEVGFFHRIATELK